MNLIQAQDRYIARVNACHPSHLPRVRRSAWKQLAKWARAHGFSARVICTDAEDVARLERNAED